MIDLLETEEIKEAIKTSPSNLQDILEEASMGICVTNSEGNFVTVNEKYCEIYGYTREELIGNSFTIVVPSGYKDKMKTLHDKFLRDKNEISRTWTVIRKNGETIEISVDTAYSEKILDQTPHKITFVQRES